MNRLPAHLALISAMSFTSACGLLGEEAAAAGALRSFFDFARRGEIASALKFVAPEHPTAQLLSALKEDNEDRYSEALIELGSRLASELEAAQLHIISVAVHGERAVISGVVLRQGREGDSFGLTAVKRDGRWLMLRLPLVSGTEPSLLKPRRPRK